jgi:hypothetical protein
MDIEITKIEPNWMHGWANPPSIYVHVNGELDDLEWVYEPLPSDRREKVMLISSNNEPWIRFVYIADPNGQPNQHGGLGGEYKLTDGSILKSRTGWSSREGIINRDYIDELADEVVNITIVRGPYSLRAGYYIYAHDLIDDEAWPDDLYLVRSLKGNNEPVWTISTNPNKVVKASDGRV